MRVDRLLPADSVCGELAVGSRRLRILRSTAPPPTDRLPLLLIHGGGSDNAAISWYGSFSAFGSDRAVIALDLPGFGGSVHEPPVGGPQAQADLIAAAVAEAGIDRAIVGGVSMGGDMALQLALRHPRLVAGLILIAPGGLVAVLGDNKVAQCAAWLLAGIPDIALLPMARLAYRFVGSALRSMVTDPDALPPEVVAEFIAEARAPGGGLGYLRYNQATLGRTGMRNDVMGRVAEITAPTLILHGDADRLVPLAGSVEAGRRMPDARLVVVPDCGHWVQLEAPQLFAAEVSTFLQRVDH